jgi:hypothetical protein
VLVCAKRPLIHEGSRRVKTKEAVRDLPIAPADFGSSNVHPMANDGDRDFYDFLEELRASLGAEQEVYKVTFLKLGTALQSDLTWQHHRMLVNPRAHAAVERALKTGMNPRKSAPILHPRAFEVRRRSDRVALCKSFATAKFRRSRALSSGG